MNDHFEAVTIETDQPARFINITNTRQVAERLTGAWPKRRGVAYTRAVKACMDHIIGEEETAFVRKTFIRAAKEAGIFVDEGHRYG